MGKKVLGRLSHLPVAVFERGAQRLVDLGAVERREREDGAAAHRGLVTARGEDGGKAGGVAEGAERGHRSLAGEGVVVRTGDGGERGNRTSAHGGRAELAERLRARFDHADVDVAEESEQRPGGRAEPGGEVGGAPPHARLGVGHGDPPRRGCPPPPPGPGEGTERRRPHARIGVAPRGPFEIGGCTGRESGEQAEGRCVRGSFDRGSPLGAVTSGHA